MKKLIGLFVVTALLFTLPTTLSAQKILIKIGDITGEATLAGYEGWSTVESFSQSIMSPAQGATGTTRRRGAAQLSDIQVVKILDKSSPKLAEAVCNGKVFPKVTVHFLQQTRAPKPQPYLTYELANVIITGYNLGASAGGGIPMEDISLNFEEINVTYEVTAPGKKPEKIEYSWNVRSNEK